MAAEPMKSCPFCHLDDRVEYEYGSMVAVRDLYPVTPGHFLIIPKRHVKDWFYLNYEERTDMDHLMMTVRIEIGYWNKLGDSITGWTIGTNCGESAGQTVMHAHTHMIPRRNGDTSNPRGGVRNLLDPLVNYE